MSLEAPLEPLDDAPAPALPPARPRAPWALAALLLALLQLGLAGLAGLTAGGRLDCPAQGGALGCDALFRPRLGRLAGPVSIAELALVGSVAAVAVAGLLWARGSRRPFARDGALLLAAGAGLALGLQALPAAADARACPVCLGIVVTAGALALVVGRGVWRDAGVRPRGPLLAFAVALLAVAPLAHARGRLLRDEDARRRAAVLQAGDPAGPEALLVTRSGCPYCEVMVPDVLGDPAVLPLLARTRGVEVVRQGDPRLAARKVERVPALLLRGAGGREALLEGYSAEPGEYARELERALDALGR